MKYTFLLLTTIAVFSCKKDYQSVQTSSSVENAVTLPHPDHIIFVWFENHNYSQIVGKSAAPYINSLIAQGTLFTNDFAIGHPSYPNYMEFFAGTANGIHNDDCINTSNWTIPNLYTELNSVGKSFAWYSEDMPSTGYTGCQSGKYYEKHNPTTVFANVPPAKNKRYADFPTNFSFLENAVCITPNIVNDMHDGSVKTGDTWLKNHCSSLVDWCKTHNSIFVVYFDEDASGNNKICVVAVGQPVKVNFELGTKYNHYNWTRTICSMFGAPNNWTNNISGKKDITGCWQ